MFTLCLALEILLNSRDLDEDLLQMVGVQRWAIDMAEHAPVRQMADQSNKLSCFIAGNGNKSCLNIFMLKFWRSFYQS